ncbi:hypothetical protein TRVA0_012S02784 [Trichomonascus vanleenenianus]|uniref:uncharacterized protein n=1 Tax=Trichomonascus vanleenenianus TaxID=2268995 RepID=UPI003ECBAA7A
MTFGCRLPSNRVLVAALIFATLLLWLHVHAGVTTFTAAIPNQVHYTYLLNDPNANFNLQFQHFLSIYSVWYYWRPDAIYLHTNAAAASIMNAQEGKSGHWNRLIFNMPNLRINPVEAPTIAGNDNIDIYQMEHKSDFIRVMAVCDFGGIYLDWDAYPIQDIKILRESGFNAIAGRQYGGEMNSGVFMAKKGALLIQMWKDQMNKTFDGWWTTHSNQLLTRLGQRLARLPGEVLIMEQDSFAPLDWSVESNIELFGLHNETPSNLESFDDQTPLPSYEQGLTDRWDRPQEFPSWERDFSNTYILHAFSPARNGNPVEGFEHVTPKYVLERQSNFARALYPIAKHMYDSGVMKVDDSYLG